MVAVLLGAIPALGQATQAAGPTGSTLLDNLSASLRADNRPHPAVVRVLAPAGDALYAGSGTLVGLTPTHGLIVTNWHVIRDGTGKIWVVFPDGFRSPALVLRTDRDWDLAALAIARPAVEPVPIALAAPQIGETLTIAGYGGGSYRAVSGRCVGYAAPDAKLPSEFVQLSVAARQGDSGGPIFNARGELAGVLFGADFTETTGAFGGRVRQFLVPCVAQLQRLGPATNSPNAGPMLAQPTPLATPPLATPAVAAKSPPISPAPAWQVAGVSPPVRAQPVPTPVAADANTDPVAAQWPSGPDDPRLNDGGRPAGGPEPIARPAVAAIPAGERAPSADAPHSLGNLPASIATQPGPPPDADAPPTPWDLGRNLFALVGVLAVFLQVLRMLNPGPPRRR